MRDTSSHGSYFLWFFDTLPAGCPGACASGFAREESSDCHSCHFLSHLFHGCCWETFCMLADCGLVGNPHLTANISILPPFQRQPRLVTGSVAGVCRERLSRECLATRGRTDGRWTGGARAGFHSSSNKLNPAELTTHIVTETKKAASF